MSLRKLENLDVAGKAVIVRADLNVPIVEGKIADTTRIDRLIPTLRDLAARRAKIVLLSHFGRPNGKREPSMSLAPLRAPLEALLRRGRVTFVPECIGETAERAVAALGEGDVALLENLRFHAGEEKNDAAFAASIARLGAAYVDDAFSCAHRAHASIDRIARLLPSAAGRSMEEEITMLGKALEAPARPLAAVIGGAKISTKLALIENLLAKVDTLVIGGGMANTLLFAAGVAIGKSLCERDQADFCRAVMARAASAGKTLLLPVDAVVAREFGAHKPHRTVAISEVGADEMILDVGPRTVASIEAKLGRCRTVVWNGPLGAFEYPPFDAGTTAVARAIAALTKSGELLSVAGGGETVAAVNHAGVADGFSYLSTAGGAFLEWLEGRVLPGVAVLMD